MLAGRLCGLSHESRGKPAAEEIELERLRDWDYSGSTGRHDSRYSREGRGRRPLRRRGRHLVNRPGPSDQRVPGSVELMIPKAGCEALSPGPLGPATPAAPPAADGYHQGGGSRKSQACLAEMSGYPPGRSCPCPRLRLAVCCDPASVRTAPEPTACLTGEAVGMAGRIGQVGRLADHLVPVTQAPSPSPPSAALRAEAGPSSAGARPVSGLLESQHDMDASL